MKAQRLIKLAAAAVAGIIAVSFTACGNANNIIDKLNMASVDDVSYYNNAYGVQDGNSFVSEKLGFKMTFSNPRTLYVQDKYLGMMLASYDTQSDKDEFLEGVKTNGAVLLASAEYDNDAYLDIDYYGESAADCDFSSGSYAYYEDEIISGFTEDYPSCTYKSIAYSGKTLDSGDKYTYYDITYVYEGKTYHYGKGIADANGYLLYLYFFYETEANKNDIFASLDTITGENSTPAAVTEGKDVMPL